MREIGSEFWDVPTRGSENHLFSEPVQWFLSGRTALRSILKDLKGCRTAALPMWCCDSMVKPFSDAGMEVRFYPVYPGTDGQLKQEITFACDILFVMDYFGYTSQAGDFSDYQGTVIRDVTHSLFSSSYSDADYYFGSLRKWTGVWTGGYAWTKDGHALPEGTADDCGYTALRRKAMESKKEYLDGKGNKGYLEVFGQAEELLDEIGIVRADGQDVQRIPNLDADFIRATRRRNAEILRKAFPDWLLFPEMRETDCPMFVPVLVPDGKRDGLRRHLTANEIYCPVHWPVSEYHRLDSRSEDLYKNELSLVCDQRYTPEDMNRIVSVINDFMKE